MIVPSRKNAVLRVKHFIYRQDRAYEIIGQWEQVLQLYSSDVQVCDNVSQMS